MPSFSKVRQQERSWSCSLAGGSLLGGGRQCTLQGSSTLFLIPLYTENYMQVGDPESERLITMTSLPVANNVQYTHYIHIVYTKTLCHLYTGSRHSIQTILIELFLVNTLLRSQDSLVPRPLPCKAERGSGVLSDISCHMGRGRTV